MPNPSDHADLYERIVVGDTLSPGIVTVTSKRTHKWDIKAADSTGGASTEYKGEELAAVTTAFQLVKDDSQAIDEFEEWEAFVARLEESLKQSPPRAWAVYHPELNLIGVTVMAVASIGTLEHDGMGGAVGTIEWIEWRPPKPKGGAAKPKAKVGFDANQDARDELERVLEEAKKV